MRILRPVGKPSPLGPGCGRGSVCAAQVLAARCCSAGSSVRCWTISGCATGSTAPIEEMQRGVQPQAGQPRRVRRPLDRRIEVRHGKREPPGPEMQVRAVLKRRGKARIRFDRVAEGFQRAVE